MDLAFAMEWWSINTLINESINKLKLDFEMFTCQGMERDVQKLIFSAFWKSHQLGKPRFKMANVTLKIQIYLFICWI